MDAIQIVAIGLVATISIVIVREVKPEFTILISLATGILIFFMILDKLHYVVQVLNDLSKEAKIDFIYFTTILKIIGIAYVIEFGAQVSRDANEESIATKIELGGKVIILVLAMPILLALMDLIIKILP
ncbi:MAG TPA: stage III sporulation protein AD [Tissierellales bacterium]|nr:stage III sporulation protein AD [Tissierellales bacterium]